MKNCLHLLFFAILVFVACSPPYKRAGKGFEYRIIPGSGGKKLAYGNFMEFHIRQEYKDRNRDTVLGDSRDLVPHIERFDSSTMPPAYLEIFTGAKAGDSIVIRTLTDSAFNSPGKEMPSYMSRGGYVYTTVKILDVFEKRYLADSARRVIFRKSAQRLYNVQLARFEKDIEKNRAQTEADSRSIIDWLEKHKIRYTRGKWGTFVVVHEEGTGENIDYRNVIAVNYTGRTLESGKVFDSNLDPKFGHGGTYEVTMSHLGEVIPGWTDGLLQLKNGSKATFYIPSSLAYGKKGNPPWIKPGDNLVFDIEVVNVITEDEAMRIAGENRKKAEEAEERQADSLKKGR